MFSRSRTVWRARTLSKKRRFASSRFCVRSSKTFASPHPVPFFPAATSVSQFARPSGLPEHPVQLGKSGVTALPSSLGLMGRSPGSPEPSPPCCVRVFQEKPGGVWAALHAWHRVKPRGSSLTVSKLHRQAVGAINSVTPGNHPLTRQFSPPKVLANRASCP